MTTIDDETVQNNGTTGAFVDDRQKTHVQSSMRPIIGLTKGLPKNVLERIVVEAILTHRHLRDIAELRYAECRTLANSENMSSDARSAYVRAMIDMHAQQTVLSTLLDVLGHIPKVPASDRGQ